MPDPSGSSAFDIVVVGGGPAGIGAACAAAESGKSVALLDESPWPGGQIWRGESLHAHVPSARRWLDRLRRSHVAVRGACSVIAPDQPGSLLVEDSGGPGRICYESLVLCTGARERFLPFLGWTQPHVVGGGGLQTLVKSGWPIAGQRVVIAGSGPLLLAVADGLSAAGASVVAIAEQAPWDRVRAFGFGLWRHPAKLAQGLALRARLASVPYLCGWWPLHTEADGLGARVHLTNGSERRELRTDLLACAFGLIPNVELARLLGCRIAREDYQDHVVVGPDQATSLLGVHAAGEVTGIAGADVALVEGRIAGYTASGLRSRATALIAERDRWTQFRSSLTRSFALRPELKSLPKNDTIICRCEDVTFGALTHYGSARQAKLQTRCGMGPCQGRVCGGATSFLFGWSADTVRPPVTAARVATLMLADPVEGADA